MKCDVKFGYKTAVALGAGPEQLYAIRVAAELGVRVVAFDRDPAAPGFALTDVAYASDPADRFTVLRICRQEGVDFVLPTPMGALLEVAGFLNGQLGLPGIGERAARLCADKLEMRAALRAAKLAQPWCEQVDDLSALGALGDERGWPILIKPRSGSGSHGVVVLRGPEDVGAHLEWHTAHASRGGCAPGTLVEQWIAGPEFGIDAAMVGGRFHLICVRRKEVTPLPFRLATGVSSPPELPAADVARLSAAAGTACRALALDDCLVHVDMILDERTNDAVVIELGGRPSGFRISSQFVPLLKGFEPVREMIRYYGGERPDFSPRSERAGAMRMLVLPEGDVAAVDGVDAARAVEFVEFFECNVEPGDTLRRADAGSSILGNGCVIAIAPNVGDALVACSEAVQRLEVHYHARATLS